MTRVDGRSMVPYLPRLVDAQLDRILATFPAALVLGPRASGKTTTARRIASDVVELDDPPQAAPFRADAGAALRARLQRRTTGPVLLDEWQAVPEVLNAVKRAVDQGAEPGSLLLTGSVRASLTSASWAGTGRVIQVDMHPMTVLEQRARAQPRCEFVARRRHRDRRLGGFCCDLCNGSCRDDDQAAGTPRTSRRPRSTQCPECSQQDISVSGGGTTLTVVTDDDACTHSPSLPLRFLIEGPPNIGKTTVIGRLVSSWKSSTYGSVAS